MLQIALATIVLCAAGPGWWTETVYDPRSFGARAQYYFALGSNVQKTRAYDEALNLFTTAVEYDPGFVQAYAARAEMNCRLGREAEAAADLQHANSLARALPGRKAYPETCRELFAVMTRR